jgi:ankyrin repeat protein
MLAAQKGYREVVELLVQAGADIEQQNEVSAYRARFVSSLSTRLLTGKYIAVCLQSGHTALMLAAQAGHVEVVNGLVQAGADIETCDEVSDT